MAKYLANQQKKKEESFKEPKVNEEDYYEKDREIAEQMMHADGQYEQFSKLLFINI